MPKDPDDYKKNRAWYLAREASPEGVRKRVERAKARNAAIKSGALNGKHDPREVDQDPAQQGRRQRQGQYPRGQPEDQPGEIRPLTRRGEGA
jgi:hypothetical protein